MPSTKVLVLVAFACSTTVSANCSGGTCMEDETSLVQLQSAVKHRGDQRPHDEKSDTTVELTVNTDGADGETEVRNTKSDSETESLDEGGVEVDNVEIKGPGTQTGPVLPKAQAGADHLDKGAIGKAFKKNYFKVRDDVETNAADDIAFDDAVHKLRKNAHDIAHDRVKKAYRDLQKTKTADRNKLEDVQDKRHGAVEDAVNEVKMAKQDYLAHRIKREQAEAAARLGRKMGAIEGKTEARRAWADYRAESVREDKEDSAKEKAADKKQAIKDYRENVNQQTKRMQEREEAYADRVERQVDAAEAYDQARTGIKMESIEGPEGLKNTVDKIKADWRVQHYQRHTDENQHDIKDAVKGHIEDTQAEDARLEGVNDIVESYGSSDFNGDYDPFADVTESADLLPVGLP